MQVKVEAPPWIDHKERLEGRRQNEIQEWLQSANCSRCGRKLTNPESIKMGIGPTCAGIKRRGYE